MNTNVQKITTTVKANQTAQIPITGTFLLFASNAGTFKFSIDGGPFQDGFSILGINFAEDPTNPQKRPFTSILLQDTSGGDNAISVVISNSPVSFTNPNTTIFQKDAPTFIRGSNHLLFGGGSFSIPNTNGGHAQRAVIIHNTDPAVPIQVWDSANEPIMVLNPGAGPIRIDTSDTIQVVNATGGGMTSPVYTSGVYFAA